MSLCSLLQDLDMDISRCASYYLAMNKIDQKVYGEMKSASILLMLSKNNLYHPSYDPLIGR